MTLSLFPSLLSYSAIAPFLIRLTLGAIFILWGYREIRKHSSTSSDKIIAGIEGVAGILLVVGLWVQGAALFAIVDLAVRLGHKIKSKKFLTDGVNYYLILLVLAVTLLITGAGRFAFDLPL